MYVVLQISGGGELPYKTGWGCSSEILKRTLKKHQALVPWAWLEFFSPLRGINSTTAHYGSPAIVFFDSIKVTAKVSAVDLSSLIT